MRKERNGIGTPAA